MPWPCRALFLPRINKGNHLHFLVTKSLHIKLKIHLLINLFCSWGSIPGLLMLGEYSSTDLHSRLRFHYFNPTQYGHFLTMCLRCTIFSQFYCEQISRLHSTHPSIPSPMSTAYKERHFCIFQMPVDYLILSELWRPEMPVDWALVRGGNHIAYPFHIHNRPLLSSSEDECSGHSNQLDTFILLRTK